jgi:nitroimidazol reductase NimA-like FMN-containing flavoprotein (pyridoxamine 5'-phosphate oxidase superfamily)
MISEANVWVDELGTDQCWRLLERCSVGRLGFTADGEQLILPVNYATDKRQIVVRTGGTIILEALGGGATVAFEVDGVDVFSETGWSVLVKGHASEIDAPVAGSVLQVTLHPWASGPRDHWLRIVPSSVTGRAISRELRPPGSGPLPQMPPD